MKREQKRETSLIISPSNDNVVGVHKKRKGPATPSPSGGEKKKGEFRKNLFD